jgi:hypothetical protein
MTTALTPALALDYIRELSADVIGGVVLDAGGDLLAGPEVLAVPARALLAAAGATRIEGRTAAGAVFGVRDEAHAIVVATGRFALSRITHHDLRTALAALGAEGTATTVPAALGLGAGGAPEGPPAAAERALVEALLAAARDHFRRHSAVSRTESRT